MTRGDGFSVEVGRRTREQVNVLMRLGFDDAQSHVRRSEHHPDVWDFKFFVALETFYKCTCSCVCSMNGNLTSVFRLLCLK